MFKKDLKERKVTTYTNNVHLPFGDSSIGTPKLSVFSLEQSYVWWPLRNFPKKHVSEDKNILKGCVDVLNL